MELHEAFVIISATTAAEMALAKVRAEIERLTNALPITAELAAMRTAEHLLRFLENGCCDLRCVADAADSYHWEVIEHHMAEPRERMIGFGSTAVEAIQAAVAAERQDP